jgi:transcriptional regulator with XRE-family HTH domain
VAREPEAITELRRVLGERLATFRQAAGLTQGQMAARLYCDRSTLAHIERERNLGTAEFWQAADDTVRADGALTRGYSNVITARHDHETRTREATLAKARARADAIRQGDEHIALSVQLGLTGNAVGSEAGMADSPSITAIRAMSESFSLADRKLGGGLLYGQVVRYIRSEIAPALLDPPRGCSSEDLFSAAASFAERAGWMAHDGGRNDKARAHFGQAYHLAAVARNPPLSANICASLAHLANQLGKADDAIRIATAGLPWAAYRASGG